ncbi:MAG: hypothetical protein LQ347_000377 [Umbilicaria vellea]|nr:MAG: hypothetical protein LQ347_000377 [Umbilicaria vellea]
MAKAHVEYRASLHITAFVVALQGLSEQTPTAAKSSTVAGGSHVVSPLEDANHILRLLTPVVKGLTSKAAISGFQECKESLGGAGYLENDEPDFNIARLYRDANFLPIWEGTTDMMADGVYRVIRGKTGRAVIKAMDRWVDMMLLPASGAIAQLRGPQLRNEENTVSIWWQELKNDFVDLEGGEFRARGRELMERLGNIVSGSLLIADAHRDGNSIAAKIASFWVESKSPTRLGARSQENWQERSAWERRIVFGEEAKPMAHL